MNTAVDLRPDEAGKFWGEIAPHEHLVQIYADEAPFLDALEGFVVGGLRAGEAVIVIATADHLNALEQRVQAQGFNLDVARSQNQYISLDAKETLFEFLLGGWPDDVRFRKVVGDLLVKARRNGRRVRAFGEMVALLWSQGHNGATVRLEQLWHQFCQKEEFSLFCAYPRGGFTQDADASIREICSAHSKVINLSR
jgi:MEDS: MEthanogen/methylotroph, DcmR Sensory domain